MLALDMTFVLGRADDKPGVCSCSALENHIYQDGVDSLRRVLCNELTDLCRLHDLHDHGEL